jgi:hypothetical protein
MRFSQNGDHSQEDLAKFGYRSGMKIKNIFTSFLFFWLLAGTFCRNLVIFNFLFLSKSGELYRLEPFFSQKSFVFVESISFQVFFFLKVKIWPPQKNTASPFKKQSKSINLFINGDFHM